MKVGVSLLLAIAATTTWADDIRGPQERQVDAQAILGSIHADGEPAARCYGLYTATRIAGQSLRRVSQEGMYARFPEGIEDPFEWADRLRPRPSRAESEIGLNYGQLYLDAFGGLSWLIGNMALYQEDTAFCMDLWTTVP